MSYKVKFQTGNSTHWQELGTYGNQASAELSARTAIRTRKSVDRVQVLNSSGSVVFSM